jgi:hypothetical protein
MEKVDKGISVAFTNEFSFIKSYPSRLYSSSWWLFFLSRFNFLTFIPGMLPDKSRGIVLRFKDGAAAILSS